MSWKCTLSSTLHHSELLHSEDMTSVLKDPPREASVHVPSRLLKQIVFEPALIISFSRLLFSASLRFLGDEEPVH